MPLTVPKGPYAVSTLTLEVPARRSLPESRFRRRDNGQDPFQLHTSLVTLFYPTARRDGETKRSLGRPLSWLNEPRLKAIEGLLKYAGVSRYLAYPAIFALPFTAKLPYGSDGPLATEPPSIVLPSSSNRSNAEAGHTPSDAPDSARAESSTFPVGVFSHGLAGSRTTYSAYLAELASEGMIVAAVEHRDGSAPYTQIRQRKSAESSTQEQDVLYFKFDELQTVQKDAAAGEENTTVWDMRKAQLQQRQAEVLEAVDLLQALNDGQGEQMAHTSTRGIDAGRAELSQWKGKLDMRNIWALGHSFGGATSIELLRRKDAPFTHAVVLDPWLEPIAKVNEAGVERVGRPLFVINSDAFTIWRKHFAWLRDFALEARQHGGQGWLITVTKTKHTDFSDFPFLMPRIFQPASGRTPLDMLDVFVKASRSAFLNRTPDASTFDLPWRDERPNEVQQQDLGKAEQAQVILHPLEGPPDAAGFPVNEQPRL